MINAAHTEAMRSEAPGLAGSAKMAQRREAAQLARRVGGPQLSLLITNQYGHLTARDFRNIPLQFLAIWRCSVQYHGRFGGLRAMNPRVLSGRLAMPNADARPPSAQWPPNSSLPLQMRTIYKSVYEGIVLVFAA
jgi:hypothetical protein